MELALAVVGAIVVLASLFANVIPPTTIGGRVLHWIAGNGPMIQRAIAEFTKPRALSVTTTAGESDPTTGTVKDELRSSSAAANHVR